MSSNPNDDWSAANQRYLSAAVADVRRSLKRYIARVRGDAESEEQQGAQLQPLGEAAHAMPAPSALEKLCAAFGLSPFERDVLLLCAGMELDAGFPSLCAAAQGGDLSRAYPTFSLALAALPEAHWSALTPAAPLRHWRLIDVGAGSALTQSPLRIDERVVHYLTGISYLDERLAGLVDASEPPGELAPSQQAVAARVTAAWARPGRGSRLPVVQLCGNDTSEKRAIAAHAVAAMGLGLMAMDVDVMPTAPSELELVIRLWEREAALTGSALLLDCDRLDAADAARINSVSRIIQLMRAPLIIAIRERWHALHRHVVTMDVHKPAASEQRTIWQRILQAAAPELNGRVDALVSQFNLGASAIEIAGGEAIRAAEARADDLSDLLWNACRVQARPRLDDLAQRIEPSADWDLLVLPTAQHETLREIVAHVRQRTTVYETWGFGRAGTRGLGISALFAGASGTGKTLAAEVLAHELRLDLYRIDLSSVVSKYIGETEKNLRRVFDAAEEGGVILLFDEADALFGKRSEVKDSHDRYANIEVSYLLQRMEVYRGLAILTTNLKSALDAAFLRRIHFVVQFPFPDATQRAEIWRRIFPPETPTEGLDVAKLARLNVAGGNIRNIALNGAFLAADAKEPVHMRHLLRAAQTEYAKLEKPLTEMEVAGWVEPAWVN